MAVSYEEALKNLNAGGLTGNTLATAQASLASAYKTPVATTAAATPATAYKNVDLGTYDGTPDDTISDALNRAATAAKTTPSESTIYRQKLSMYQDQINAVNSLYAEKLKETQTQSLGNLGSARATEARSGLLGSDFASAQNDNVTTQNNAVEQSVRDEQASKIAAIMGLARQDAADELAAKRAAQQQGTKDYLDYLSARTTRQASNATKVAAALLDQNVDTSQVDPTQLATIAKTYGISTSDIVAEYNKQKKAKDDEAAKANAQAVKDNSFSLSEGQDYYKYDPDTGKYDLVASKAKTYAPKDGGSGSYDAAAPLSTEASAVLANPALLANFTPTKKGAIISELAAHGQDLSAFGLNDPSGGQRDNIAKYGDLERAANLASSALATGTFGTGPVQGSVDALKQKVGAGDPNYTDYSGAISNLSSILLNLRSGAAVSPSEAQRLQGFIPSVGDQEDVAKQKITNFITEMQNARQNYINTATQSTASLVKTGATTVKMTGPGGTFEVPADKVATFQANGYHSL